MNRREVLTAGSLLVASNALYANASKEITTPNSSQYTIEKLPTAATTLQGISKKVIESHYQNNYSGAVKKLNLISHQLAHMPDSAHPIEYGALKKEELIALNSKLWHELYFSNLSANSSRHILLEKLLSEAFGSFEQWKKGFIKTAKSLSGGSGWVILTYIKPQNRFINQIASDHSDSVAIGTPLLVLDMYEHSYHMDYGANAGKYIDAFMENINYEEVYARYLRA